MFLKIYLSGKRERKGILKNDKHETFRRQKMIKLPLDKFLRNKMKKRNFHMFLHMKNQYVRMEAID